MKLILTIAWRYFIGKKSAQAINIISWISLSAILLASAAMIILFSVFNGIESLLKEQYKGFYPDLKVQPLKGKFVTITEEQKLQLLAINHVQDLALIVEDMVLLVGEDQQKIAQLKGVEASWFNVNNIGPYITEGNSDFESKYSITPAVVGTRIAAILGVSASNLFSTFTIFHPKLSGSPILVPSEAYNTLPIQPIGQFNIDALLNDKYVIIPYLSAIKLFELNPNQYSAIEIKTDIHGNTSKIKKDIQAILGENCEILDTYQQNKTMYMVVFSEKMATYVILLFVLFIASFNLIGSLSMLVIEKKKDIAILKTMGMSASVVHRIFLSVGIIISGIGCLLGVILGFLLCLGQQQFGWITMGEDLFSDPYPITFKFLDFIIVFVTVVVVGSLAAIYPAYKARKQSFDSLQQ